MATITWNGGGGDANWATTANWAGGVAPVAGDDLVFAGTTQLTPNNNITADTSFASITFSAGAGAFNLTGNRITLTGNVTNSSSNAQTLNIAVIVNVATCNLSASASGSLNMAGVISETGGARIVAAVGAGIVTLGAANTFSGGFSLNAGTIRGNASASFGTGTVTCAGGTVITGNLGNNPIYANAFVLNGQLNVQVPFSGGYDVELAGVVSGTGSIFVSSDASGRRFYLSNANTFSGGVISGASGQSVRLHVGTNTSLGSGTVTIDQTGSGGVEAQVNGLVIANPIVINSGRILNLQTQVATLLTLSGVISGAGALNMSANTGGACILSNTCTYTGATTVTSGSLLITGSIAAASAVSVNSGGILGGTGTINGAITLVTGGTLAPGATIGNSIGTLNTAAVTCTGGTYSVDLNGTTPTFDRITSSGVLALGSGVVTLAIPNYASSAFGKVFTIASAVSITGSFASAPHGTILNLASRYFRIVYTSTTVTLTDVSAKVWNGGAGTGSWTTATNWVGSVAPSAGDHLVFAGAVQLTPTNDFAADTSFASITFAAGASAFTLAAGARITLTERITNISSNTQTVSIAVILNGACEVDGTAELVLGGTVSETGGARSLTKNGANTVRMLLSTTYTGTETVSAGTLQLQGDFAAGTHSISSGAVLEIYVASGILNSANNATISGSGTLRKTGAGEAVWGAVVVTFALGSGSLIDVVAGTFTGGSFGNDVWTSNLSDLTVASGATFSGVEANIRVNRLNGAGTITTGYPGAGYVNFTFGVDNGSGGTFSGAFVDSVSAGSIEKVGTGTQTFSGTNTYTGTTTVTTGTLIIALAASLPSATALTVAAAGTLNLQGVTSTVASATFQAGATLKVNVSTGPVVNGKLIVAGTATISGSVAIGSVTAPIVSQAYTVLLAATVTGTFQSAGVPYLLGGRNFTFSYPSNTVVLTDGGLSGTFFLMFC
jgi:autotransporter-associated beta strand protein